MLSIGSVGFGVGVGIGVVSGQSYPNKPIRIVTSEPGGGLDFSARLIAPGLTATLGQQVIIDNRGGAGGPIAGETTTILLLLDRFSKFQINCPGQ